MYKKLLIILSLLSFELTYSQKLKEEERIKENSGACYPAVCYAKLDINNIEAMVMNGGDMFWDLFGSGRNHYYFPKGSQKNMAGPSAIWIGGFDGGGQLKTAAQTYRQSGYDFWPGPLNDMGSTNDELCAKYNRLWKIDYKEITDLMANYKAGNLSANTFTPTECILNWPTIDSSIYYTSTLDYSKIAPFKDVNTDGVYNLKDGDYPIIKGDQEIFCVFNDRGDIHTETGGQPIGVEVQLTAYAYGCKSTISSFPQLANTTFYHYKIINRSAFKLVKTYVAIWSDANIGDNKNDYVGSNVNAGYGYTYNATNFDSIYGNILPAQATVLLKGPLADPYDGIDNDGDGTTDETGEEFLIPNFYYFNTDFWGSGNSIPQMTGPNLSSHYYNYMSGFWKDGSPMTCGGNAYGGSVPTKNVFPSAYTPIGPCGNNWTEVNAGNTLGDRTYLLSVGPFTFTPGSEIEFEIAFVTSVDSNSIANPIGSITKLETDVQKIKSFYNLPIKPSCIDTNKIAKTILPKKGEITLGPNPVEQELIINFQSFYQNSTNIKIYDVLGRLLWESNYINQEIAKIDLTNLSKAVYLIEITSGSYKDVKKLFKQ